MKKLSILILCCFLQLFAATPPPNEPYEGLPVRKIRVTIENQAPGDVDEEASVLYKMQTKMGDSFDQEVFDRDLKVLSEEYEWVDPTIKVENQQVFVSLVLKKRPVITALVVEGTSFKTKKILNEADLSTGMTYNREEFYKSIQKIRDFLVKKGYFKAEVNYAVENTPNNNEVTIVISIHEGPKGRINEIVFEGFTKKEEKEIWELIRVREFSALTSWLTGSGTIKEEELDPDVQAIVGYLQNHGYVDAHVSVKLEDMPNNKLALVFHLERGPKYSLHKITFSGEHLKNEEELKKASKLQPGEVFSIDKIRAAQEKVRELYTQEGYLHTNVDYRLDLLPHTAEYNVHFTIEESQKYRVGLVMVSGNYCTTKNVVYNNIDIEPGEVFDSRKIKSTQERLQSTGYFKNVNVYPVKSDEHQYGSSEYCDVMVEVNEAQTGNASLFAGFSSTDSVFGGIDLTENNFSLAGFRNVWTKGPTAFRGGGQYLQVKGSIGLRESGVNISWLEPYFNDTLWRFGVDLEYQWTNVVAKDYNINTFGTVLNASYPLSSYFNYGFRFRVRDSIIGVKGDVSTIEKDTIKNIGVVSGIASVLRYDSTDNAFRPHRGFRSSFEAEFAGLVRQNPLFNDFPFLRFGWLNSYYYSLNKKGTFKIRGDARFLQPLLQGLPTDFPVSERFFLGGEGTVRGYAPGKVGPLFTNGVDPTYDPMGGMTSLLFTVEYLHSIIKMLDVFAFFDTGSVSMQPWSINQLAASYGTGVRLDIGRRLPFVLGVGFPIFPGGMPEKERDARRQTFFFSMAGQF
ncbi:MAG: outer membrane protein assembly factor BamA [Chlamydiae bacterium]|nr:outer membrane protein assembly factor BamA [Chlamydiota bacterium]